MTLDRPNGKSTKGDPLVKATVLVDRRPAWEADRSSMAAPEHQRLAAWLLDYETRDLATDSHLLAAAVERVLQKFFNRLEKVASLAACLGLLSRAVHISRAGFGFLLGVRAGVGESPLLDGLGASIEGVDPVYARAGVEEVLGTLIRLLAALIGEDLTLRMVREVWPGVPELTSLPIEDSNSPNHR